MPVSNVFSMAIDQDLKIFISWSGDLAKEVTKVLRAWLPKMFDHLDPWASEVDIDAGTRGLHEIQDRLNASAFGIIVVTTENMSKPWLNFEAGALSKTLGGDPTRVVPLLVNFDDVYQLQGPISQFQAIKLNKEGMSRLCRSVATVIGLDPLTIDSRFEWAWSSLETAVGEAKDNVGDQPKLPEVSDTQLLKALLATVNTLQTNLTTQASLAHSAGSPYIVESGLNPNRRVSGYVPTADPWKDGAVMQQVQDEIKEYVQSTYRPVRYVSPMEWKGQKVVGVVFEDGQGMTADSNDFNDFTNAARRHWPAVTVAIVSDSDLENERAR